MMVCDVVMSHSLHIVRHVPIIMKNGTCCPSLVTLARNSSERFAFGAHGRCAVRRWSMAMQGKHVIDSVKGYRG